MTEQWKDIPGFDGYQVSDCGRIRGVDRTLTDGRTWQGKILKTHENHRGYVYVTIRKDGRAAPAQVHRLVLKAFKGPCPTGMEAAHNDGIPNNNNIQNLRWDTRKNNERDKLKHGTALIGERHHKAKLTEPDIRKIRIMRDNGVHQRTIAAVYGVSQGTIGFILRGEHWRHVR